MSNVADAATMLESALDAIEGVRRQPLGEPIQPPATVLGPPALRWESPAIAPSDARFLVYAIEAANDRALERLWDLVEVVVEVVDAVSPSAAVISAEPAVYESGTTQLPCYEIVVEVALND